MCTPYFYAIAVVYELLGELNNSNLILIHIFYKTNHILIVLKLNSKSLFTFNAEPDLKNPVALV